MRTIRSSAMTDLGTGPDGVERCSWATATPELLAYHDGEWGQPLLDDDGLFEHLCLEAFQSGLSWLTVLRKRPAFREVFAGFRIEAVAQFGDDDIARLLADERIIRNRQKITAAIENARCARELIADGGSLVDLIWSHRPQPAPAPRSYADIPTSTPDSTALARELKRRGFRFIGPTTAYALKQACGLVNDHLEGCAIREPASRAQAEAAKSLF
jgi:DNA-3-methyladenine glycosylase I